MHEVPRRDMHGKAVDGGDVGVCLGAECFSGLRRQHTAACLSR